MHLYDYVSREKQQQTKQMFTFHRIQMTLGTSNVGDFQVNNNKAKHPKQA